MLIYNHHLNRQILYIDNPKNLLSPVMAMGFNSLPNNYSQIKAGTHPYDRTVRPQFVSSVHNPNYYALINEYSKISGVPALLNTSFNLHGEPVRPGHWCPAARGVVDRF